MIPPPRRDSGALTGVLLGIGIFSGVLGVIGLLADGPDHSACQSVFVQALDQGACAKAGAVWTLSVMGIVIGVLLIVVAVIVRPKS